MPRESELTLGVTARVELAAHDRLVARHAAIEGSDEMRDAMRAHRRQSGIELSRTQGGDFLKRA
jgi:hypothetical protein